MPSLRILESLNDVAAEQWDALHDGSNPFVRHAFLAGLERHGCIRAGYGWTPQHLTLWQDDLLVAAAPGYLKGNSHGEFVFDHAWAHAFAQHGRDYFPKWLCAVPYSPVSGPRLLARDDASRMELVAGMQRLVHAHGLSSAHVNFHGTSEDVVFGHISTADPHAGRWSQRLDVQYHWRNLGNAAGDPWRDFDDFLAAMDHKHRKNIRQERARVRQSGVAFRVVHGDEASSDDIVAIHGFYLRTFADYGNTPALTLEFLQHLAQEMPRQLVIVLAERVVRQAQHERTETIAGALCLRGADTLYGRYWGMRAGIDPADFPGLHFETCYYQGIDYCLRERLHRFEPGAQGEHKLARGFLPQLTHSRHFIADPAFAQAIETWCAQDRASVQRYADALSLRAPFRASSGLIGTR